MRTLEKKTIALKLAEALLLLYKGEISIREIEAIPLLDDSRDAKLIARHLRSKFKTKLTTLRVHREEIGSWEEIIKLVR
uniref:SMC-Scp complex subunit ScpB n=1 Tax=candidate division WOR-3 bacterium TaxID=2052148 RepID=A0A7C3YS09_UNCW3